MAVRWAAMEALENLRLLVARGMKNDFSKYAIPDAYLTELTWTVNARSLQNFLWLRTAKAALWEIRQLASAVYENLPDDHKYLFTDFVNIEKKESDDG